MGEIRIDYDLMNTLADQMYTLRDKINVTSQIDHSFAGPTIGPDPRGAQAISDFYSAWKQAFQRGQDAMTTLGNDFDSVGQQFFDTDASIATQASQQTAQMKTSNWQQQKQAWDQYNSLKNQTVTTQVVDAHGNLVFGKDGKPVMHQTPAWDPSQTPPADPGPMPAGEDTNSGDGATVHTQLLYQDGKVVGVDTQVENSYFGAPGTSVSYHETTMYGPNGGYNTDIHFADGTEQKIVVDANPDGSATKSLYLPGQSGQGRPSDGLSQQWTGKVNDDNSWKPTYNWTTDPNNPNYVQNQDNQDPGYEGTWNPGM